MLRPAYCKLVSVVALIVLLTSIAMSAETAPALKYDKSAEVRVKGLIEDVKISADDTVHLTLKSDKGSLDVIVAPEKFLKEMEITFAKGDSIEVLGSQTHGRGQRSTAGPRSNPQRRRDPDAGRTRQSASGWAGSNSPTLAGTSQSCHLRSSYLLLAGGITTGRRTGTSPSLGIA